ILKSILGPYYRKYLLKYIPIDQKDLHKTIKETLIELCIDRKIGTKGVLSRFSNSELLEEIANKGYDVGLFISHITFLLKNHYFQPLFDLELLIRTSKNLSVIVFSELDITHDRFNILVDKASFLYDHIIKYPMYSEADSRQFISHYNYHWNFSLPEKAIGEIVYACGGYLWLIHQAQRNLRDNPSMSVEEAVSDELMLRKLEAIWTKFSEEEKNIIRKIVFGDLEKSFTLSHEYEYLKCIKVIKDIGGKPILGIPILSHVVEKENRLSQFLIKDDRLFIGNKEITGRMSYKERIFMLSMVSSKKKIVSRDKVAQAIWGKDWEEKYSDWAIDRLAHRIRKKLRSLGIDEKLLKTVKKKGFLFG
ncbi:hypothetical protein FJZ33_01930, partial [Candidatus Poribacteria bacterium]|nr:hypothetical protein [Candidatus Poribacteria bacterium]